MAKIIYEGSAKPDDKMFLGGSQLFSPLKFNDSERRPLNEKTEKLTMKITSKGYDPHLGETFLEESTGLVVARGKSSRQNSEDTPLAKFQNPQEAHDEQMAKLKSSTPTPETEADGPEAGQKRLARWRHQNEQLRMNAGAPRDVPPIQREAQGNEPRISRQCRPVGPMQP